MPNTSSRRYLAGALAGALGGLVVMVITAIALLNVSLWQFAFNSSIPVIRDTAALAVQQDMSRLPSFLWGWRWVILGLALGGAALAWLEGSVQRFPAPWNERLTAAIVLAVLTTIIVSTMLRNADQSLYHQGTSVDSLPALASQRGDLWVQLLFSMVIALGLGSIAWFFWSWWYSRVQGWLGLPPLHPAYAPAEIPADQWFVIRQQRARAQQRTLVGLALALAIQIGLGLLYDQWRPVVQSGDVWAEPTAPQGLVQLQFTRPERTLLVENTYGNGSIVATLLDPQRQPRSNTIELVYTSIQAPPTRQALDVAGIPTGTYLLRAELRSGTGGRAGWALVQGTGALATLGAILVGIASGIVLALAVLLISLRVQRQAAE